MLDPCRGLGGKIEVSKPGLRIVISLHYHVTPYTLATDKLSLWDLFGGAPPLLNLHRGSSGDWTA